MAEIILDLSGQAGLADNFYGDDDMITPQPHLRISEPGEMVQGSYNPYLRNGYLAPAVTTSQSYTFDEAQTGIITKVKYDSVNDDVFFAEYGHKIFKTDGLSDSSLVEVLELASENTIQDIEIYTKHLQRHLFYLYGTDKQITSESTNYRSMWDKVAVSIAPLSTIHPQVIASDYIYYSEPATLTRTVTVPTSTSIACLVAIRTQSTVTSVKVDGTTMDLEDSFTRIESTTLWTTYIYSLSGVTAGSVDVEVTKSGTNATFLHILFTDNTALSPLGSIEHTFGVSNDIISRIDIVDNSLQLNFIVADNSYHNITGAGTEIFYNPATQTNGDGATMYVDDTGTNMYVDGIPSGGVYKIFQYTLGTAWDVTTATYSTKSLDYSAQIAGTLSRIKFNSTGDVLTIADKVATQTKICVYSLSTPWDISTATHIPARDFTLVLDSGTEWYGFDISGNGEHMFFPLTEGDGKQLVRHYTLSTPWDPSTAIFSEDFEYSGYHIETVNLAGNDTILVLREVNTQVFRAYNFNPLFPYDVSKLTIATSDSAATDSFTAAVSLYSLYFPNRGTYFYGRRSNDDVYRYTMTTGTLPTISTTSKIATGSLETIAHSIVTEEDNSKVIECGVAQLPFGTVTDNNWLSNKTGTNITSTSNYNFIRTADNGFAYIFTNNAVHKIDGGLTGGTEGTVTRNVLLLPAYFTITDAIDYRSRFYIASHQYPVDSRTVKTALHTGACGILVWDRLSTQLGGTEYIEIPGVREIKKIYASPDGVLKLICISDNGLTEIRQFGYNDSGGVVFPVQKKMGIGAFPNVPNGLTTAGDKVVWLANDGTLYCEKGNAVTKLFEVKAPGLSTATTIENINSGAILFGSESETSVDGLRSNKQVFVLSYKDGASYYTKKVYPFDLKTGTDAAQVAHTGNVYSGVQYIPITSIVRKIRIYNAPVYSGNGSLLQEDGTELLTETGEEISINVRPGTDLIATIKIYFNQSNIPNITKSISIEEAKRGYVDFAINKPYIHAVQVEVEWNTAEPIGVDMYLPSVAIISHDPTDTSSPDNG